MVRLDWTPSGYQFVEVFDGKDGSGYQPNKNAKQPEVEMVGQSSDSVHKGLPIPLIGAAFIMVLVFIAGIVIGMGIA